MRPDLTDPAELAAYRAELRRVAFGWRLLGFVLVAASAGWLLASDPASSARRCAWIGIAVGWTVLIGVLVHRTRYHRARMSGD